MQRGFTLVEMAIGLAIFGVLLAMALPNFTIFLQNSQIKNAAETTLTGLTLAKTEAVRRNVTMRFQLMTTVTDACAGRLAQRHRHHHRRLAGDLQRARPPDRRRHHGDRTQEPDRRRLRARRHDQRHHALPARRGDHRRRDPDVRPEGHPGHRPAQVQLMKANRT
jgi:prepilin-type N-terminal cleavage/methylation domain-containing protein